MFPTQWITGRERLATRPGLTSTGITIGTPFGSSEATWVNSGTTYRGCAIAHSGGTRLFYTSSSVVTTFGGGDFITDDLGTDFSDCAVYLQNLVQTEAGSAAVYRALSGSAGSGTTVAGSPGTAPNDCGLCETHGDRIYFGGSTTTPHILFTPRIGTLVDFDYAETDESAAWTNSGTGDGKISEPITALKSHTRDCLIVGCTDSMYVLRGNPTAGGQVETLSHQVGPLMNAAWDHDGQGNLWILTRDGFYVMPPGCGAFPQPVSADVIPIEIRSIDPGIGDHVSVCFDMKFRGIHIYVDYASGTDAHWFYDLQSGGFWPMSFASTLRLGVGLKSAATSAKSALLAINTSGGIYQFDTGTTAASEAFSSYEVRGPFMLGPGLQEGKLYDCWGVLAENSGTCVATFYVGDSEASAYAKYVAGTPTFTCGNWTRDTSPVRLMQHRQHIQASGRAAYVKIASVSNSNFCCEEVGVTTGARMPRRVN